MSSNPATKAKGGPEPRPNSSDCNTSSNPATKVKGGPVPRINPNAPEFGSQEASVSPAETHLQCGDHSPNQENGSLLSQALKSMVVDQLRSLAVSLGIDPPKRKADLISAIELQEQKRTRQSSLSLIDDQTVNLVTNINDGSVLAEVEARNGGNESKEDKEHTEPGPAPARVSVDSLASTIGAISAQFTQQIEQIQQAQQQQMAFMKELMTRQSAQFQNFSVTTQVGRAPTLENVATTDNVGQSQQFTFDLNNGLPVNDMNPSVKVLTYTEYYATPAYYQGLHHTPRLPSVTGIGPAARLYVIPSYLKYHGFPQPAGRDSVMHKLLTVEVKLTPKNYYQWRKSIRRVLRHPMSAGAHETFLLSSLENSPAQMVESHLDGVSDPITRINIIVAVCFHSFGNEANELGRAIEVAKRLKYGKIDGQTPRQFLSAFESCVKKVDVQYNICAEMRLPTQGETWTEETKFRLLWRNCTPDDQRKRIKDTLKVVSEPRTYEQVRNMYMSYDDVYMDELYASLRNGEYRMERKQKAAQYQGAKAEEPSTGSTVAAVQEQQRFQADRKPDKQKYCHKHGYCRHDTSECRHAKHAIRSKEERHAKEMHVAEAVSQVNSHQNDDATSTAIKASQETEANFNEVNFASAISVQGAALRAIPEIPDDFHRYL